MKEVESIIYDVYDNTKIDFSVTINSKSYSTKNFDKSQKYIRREFELEYSKCCIDIYAAFSSNIDLLVFYIKDKFKNIFKEKKEIIKLILDGEYILESKIKEVFISFDEVYILNIYSKSKSKEIYEYISQGYIGSNVNVIEYNNGIVIIGKLEDYLEHVNSIKETIEELVCDKFYISYNNVEDIKRVREIYLETQRKIELALKYKISKNILDGRSLVFEEIIEAISEKNKKRIIYDFEKGLLQLNSEMIKTVEVFFKCGLNLSEAAKELYIHRNTLIYRIDKIEKLVGYDIREFNDAVIFKIIFDIFKEKK